MTDLLDSFSWLLAQAHHSGGERLDLLVGLLIVFGPLVIIFFISRAIENNHFQKLDEGEQEFRDILVSDMAYPLSDVDINKTPQWIACEVTVSSSRIKDFFARWRSFFGGEIRSYQTLQDRALRETRLRLCREARAMGYDVICNLRFTAAQISMSAVKRTKDPVMIAMQGSATAYLRKTRDV